MPKNKLVSIIITTKNEAEVLGALLESIKKQTYKNLETIIVDNKSTDKTLKIAAKFTKHIFTFGPERSAQRNYGAKKSNGEYVFFLDADMELSPSVVSECVNTISQNKKIGGVAIPEESVANNFWGSVKAFERSFYNEEGDSTTDAARFFDKKIFDKIGGYDESITGPEDWDLPERVAKMGFLIFRIKAKIYHHERINSPFQVASKKYYYALTSHRYLKKHQISVFSAKTVYFLRPIFYKNWRKLVSHPILSTALFSMLFLELVAGGVGYLVGRYKES